VLCKKKTNLFKILTLVLKSFLFKLALNKPLTSHPEAGKQPKDETNNINRQKQVDWVSLPGVYAR